MKPAQNDAAFHDATILDQFTRQAEPFALRHGYSNDPLLDLMLACAEVSADDLVLDVACGPGIVSCAFARSARHVTGLDFVPAMLERARRYQAEMRIQNVTWQLGSSTELPFPAGCFDCVVTRFSFHHYLDPLSAMREMKRVAKSTGTIVVCDVAPRPEAQAAFNGWEILRDPSHVRALTQAEFKTLGKEAGLELQRLESYNFDRDLEGLLQGSFPKSGDVERIRALFAAELTAGTDHLGVAARRENGSIWLTYPVMTLAWRKPA